MGKHNKLALYIALAILIIVVAISYQWARPTKFAATDGWLDVASAPNEMRALVSKREAANAAAKQTLDRFAQLERERKARQEQTITSILENVRKAGNLRAALQNAEFVRTYLPDIGEANVNRMIALSTVPCSRPTIHREVSESLAYTWLAPFLDEPTEKEYVVEPGAKFLIVGCHFGSAGTVGLAGGPRSIAGLTFQIEIWTDEMIYGEVSRAPGIPDHPAELVVGSQDGSTSLPLAVQFRQRRILELLNSYEHRETMQARCASVTTVDQCVGLTAINSSGATYQFSPLAGLHHQKCCTSKSGTDVWTIRLKNGWILPTQHSSAYPNVLDWYLPDGSIGYWQPGSSEQGMFGGSETCRLFNDRGRITDQSVAVVSAEPYEATISISWEVNWLCSGVYYAAADIILVGPEGLSYW